MKHIVGASIGLVALGGSILAVAPATASDATAVVYAKAKAKPGKSCPNPAVWNVPIHTKKYGWLECKLDRDGTGWHYRHIHHHRHH